jgi:hypothetical protein
MAGRARYHFLEGFQHEGVERILVTKVGGIFAPLRPV